MKAFYKKIASSGPGGRACGCCYPQNSKFRNKAKKHDAKVERKFLTKLIEGEVNEL